MHPKIAIVHVSTIPGESFEEFRSAIAHPEVDVQVVATEPPGLMAGVEWLMPAFVTAFVTSAYFGGFFQEMGKDHYLLLKEQLKKLYPKVAGRDAPNVEIVGTKGKLKEAQPYSLYFSIMGEGPDGRRVKLLLRKNIQPAEYEHCVDVFMDLLKEMNSGTMSDEVRKRFESATCMGRTMLVVYDDALRQVVPINPRTGELER